MNNYRNYGNRRVPGETADCGCNGNNYGRGMRDRGYGRQETDCGCDRRETRREADCGCEKREIRREADCGCDRREVRRETNCGCEKKEMRREMDCGCEKKEAKRETDCGCTTESMYREMKKEGSCCKEDMPGKALAMAYVPWQSWGNLYEICEGFSTGTIFKELNLEFCGRRCN